MKLELNTEQLELLEFILSEFEYEDDKERTLIEQIEAQIYSVREEDLLRETKILKAQAKQPTMEWKNDATCNINIIMLFNPISKGCVAVILVSHTLSISPYYHL